MTPPSEPPTIGSHIKAARLSQGLSYGHLAELLGVSKSLVFRWEQDSVVPKAKYLTALARVLELSTTALMRLSGAEHPYDAPTLPAMLRAEYDLPPEAIAKIETYVTRVAKKYASKPADNQLKKSTNEGRNP